jgi:creatinine amidohydrolase
MTDFFNFDNLTWPEVADLPRDLPLVLPLGTGYAESMTAETLSHPPRIGLLPPFPFGWRGSGLEVPEPVLGQYIGNLLDSLRQDGFTRVYAVTPRDINLGLGASQLRINPHLTPGTLRLALPPDTERDKVILLPIGHTEQHAYHLPLSVDTMIIEAIAQGAAQSVPESGYALPVMPYGVSTHRDSFAGTMNAGGRAFEDFWLAVVDVLVQRGFDKFYLMSGHGGNMSFLVNVVKYAGDRHKRIFCATAFLHTAGPAGAAALEKYRESPIGGMGHACELETSMVLALRPELVHMERVVDDTDFVTTPSYYMDWIEGGALVANPPWDDDTISGAYGAGSLGTAEKGRRWLDAAIAEKVGHIHEIHEQQRRREQRRRNGFGNWIKIARQENTE